MFTIEYWRDEGFHFYRISEYTPIILLYFIREIIFSSWKGLKSRRRYVWSHLPYFQEIEDPLFLQVANRLPFFFSFFNWKYNHVRQFSQILMKKKLTASHNRWKDCSKVSLHHIIYAIPLSPVTCWACCYRSKSSTDLPVHPVKRKRYRNPYWRKEDAKSLKRTKDQAPSPS